MACSSLSGALAILWPHICLFPAAFPRVPTYLPWFLTCSPFLCFPHVPSWLSECLVLSVTCHLPECRPETSMFLCKFLSFRVPCMSPV